MDAVSLEAILRAFNAPISEQQAWALSFQTSRCLPPGPLPRSLTSEDLVVTRDGSVRVLSPPTGQSPPQTSSSSHHALPDTGSKDFWFSLGHLIYSALDFRIPKSKERVLDRHLVDFIDRLTTKEDEGSCDEGIENDEEDSSPATQQPVTRASVMQVSDLRPSASVPPLTSVLLPRIPCRCAQPTCLLLCIPRLTSATSVVPCTSSTRS